MSLQLEVARADVSLGWLMQAFRQYGRAHSVRCGEQLVSVPYDQPTAPPPGGAELAELERRARECAAWLLVSHAIADRRAAVPLYLEWLAPLSMKQWRVLIPQDPSHNAELVARVSELPGSSAHAVDLPVELPPKDELDKRPEAAVRHLREWAKTARNHYDSVTVPASELATVLLATIEGQYGDVVLLDGETSADDRALRGIAQFASDAVDAPDPSAALEFMLDGGIIMKPLREAGRLTVAGAVARFDAAGISSAPKK